MQEKPENPHKPTEENPAAESSQTEDYDTSLYSENLVFGSKKKLANVFKGRVVTKKELAEHGYILVLLSKNFVFSKFREAGNKY